MNREHIASCFRTLQDSICTALEKTDGKALFREDLWERPGGGGGRTRVIENGRVFEKGGVNFSAVHGILPANIAAALNVKQASFFATGVSIVIHPQSPMIPIIHMNVRYFEVDAQWWFGGGIDLTPHYVVVEDAVSFHVALKHTCDRFHPAFYPEFKKWADDYFFIKHRHETRGVGGIFFDRLDETRGMDKAQLVSFVKAVGETFVPVYTAIVEKNKNIPYGKNEKEWQLLRRGRYAEFNLVYDKGTKFGLDTDGRTESILMSLPPQAEWHYNHTPLANSEEAKTLSWLMKGVDWATM